MTSGWLQWLFRSAMNHNTASGGYGQGPSNGYPYPPPYAHGYSGYPAYSQQGYQQPPRAGGVGGQDDSQNPQNPQPNAPMYPPPGVDMYYQPPSQTIFGFSPFMFLLILFLIVVALAIRILYSMQERIIDLERNQKNKVGHRQMQDYVNIARRDDDYDPEDVNNSEGGAYEGGGNSGEGARAGAHEGGAREYSNANQQSQTQAQRPRPNPRANTNANANASGHRSAQPASKYEADANVDDSVDFGGQWTL